MKTAIQKFYNVKEKINSKMIALSAAAAVTLMNVMPANATFQGYSGKSGTQIIDGIVDVIAAIASFVGIILLASSIFVLVMAFKNEEVEGKHRAGLGIGVAIALLSFGGIMAFFV